MSLRAIRTSFVDRTARKPSGRRAVKSYNEPWGHYRSFNIIMKQLHLKAEDSYCEIGCGGGVLLAMALQKVRQAAAIDHSSDMVQLTRKNNAQSVQEGSVEIIEGDACHLPWPDNSFTAAANANMFFFIEEPEKVLSEIYRVLKPGGRFCMVTMGKRLLNKITFGFLYGLRSYSDRHMAAMLSEAGFSRIKVRTGMVQQVCYAEKL